MEVAAAVTGGGGIDNHETTAVSSGPQYKQQQQPRSLNRTNSSSSSSSFRLRSPSLNTLRLRRIFDIFDKNGDGNITVKELHQALNLLGLEAELSELESAIASHVKPGSDGLKFEDFVSLHESLEDRFFDFEEDQMEKESANKNSNNNNNNNMSQEDRDLSAAFNVFDEDGDGFICAKELQVVLGKLGLSEGNEIGRVQQMIGSVDRNDDGRIDFFEFKNMMQSVVVRSS